MNIFKLFLVFPTIFLLSFLEGSDPPKNIVSMSTAGMEDQGSWSLDFHLQKNGGLLSSLMIGMTSNFNIGISYGIQSLIGNQRPKLSKHVPEVHIKYRLIEETSTFPAFVLGLNTQGYGDYIDTTDVYEENLLNSSQNNRYDFKAHGFYIVLSKNWHLFGNFGLHLGTSYNSWEGSKKDKIPNLIMGIDKDINKNFIFIADYNFGLNDKNNPTYGYSAKWPGFLNAGIRWSVSDNLKLDLCVNQIKSYQKFREMNREIKILYRQYF